MLNEQDNIWPECLWIDGKRHTIKDLIADTTLKGFHLGVCGNSTEGWALYIFSNGNRDLHQLVSPVFHRDMGDTLKDLLDATERAYGVRLSPRAGKALNFFPADELWHWHTSEPKATDPKRSRKAQRKAARKYKRRSAFAPKGTWAAHYRGEMFAYLDQVARLRNPNMDKGLVARYMRGYRAIAEVEGFRLP